MPNLQTDGPAGDPNDERDDALRKLGFKLRNSTAMVGWTCPHCGAFAAGLSEAEKHQRWHEQLDGR